MNDADEFAEVTALIAEPNRAKMLWCLLDGRAYTAGELATVASISPQSASNHLNKLIEKELLNIEKQGRHRYYKLARPEIAYAIEAMANLIPEKSRSVKQQPELNKCGIKYARTCYDHLAGKMGVFITESLVSAEILVIKNKQYKVTSKGATWFGLIGIKIDDLAKSKRAFALQCLDWSERKHHLAGALGAALLHKMLEKDWIRRKQGSREVIFTHLGEESLENLFRDFKTNTFISA
ncbi:MAG: metalloregulator ArsR/SmtB family transcription factor [Reichenbachiella sp.]|uniref:ArsR/SmtB family transcription factor n=1 Tax=Reichenbachiella sp. TaxID=2184521 RepID=UPI00326534F4